MIIYDKGKCPFNRDEKQKKKVWEDKDHESSFKTLGIYAQDQYFIILEEVVKVVWEIVLHIFLGISEDFWRIR